MATTNRLSALALAAVVFAFPAAAQEGGPRIGIGVGLPTSEISSLFTGLVTPAYVYVPIELSSQFRLEPQVGILTVKQDDGGDEVSMYSVGTGVFFLVPAGQHGRLYVGPRIVLTRTTEENVGGGGVVTETKGTDWWFAAALGGEIMAHPRIGVGAEAQVGYTAVGDRDTTVGGVDAGTEPGGSSIQTQGVIFVRVYF